MVCFAALGDLLDEEIDARYIGTYIYIYIHTFFIYVDHVFIYPYILASNTYRGECMGRGVGVFEARIYGYTYSYIAYVEID